MRELGRFLRGLIIPDPARRVKFICQPPEGAELGRTPQLRKLAIEAWTGDLVVIEIPKGLCPISEKDLHQMRDAIHNLRFPGEELQDSDEAREALENYRTGFGKIEGKTVILIAPSEETWNKLLVN